jgi:hypothetical protein
MRHAIPSSRRVACQQGMAMIALITLLALISAYLISSLLTRTNSEVLVDRSQRAQDALLQAKAALIAYAADPSSTQPGALPCPDTNNDGVGEPSCSGTNVVVGRLPWQSLGTGDLRDASGERLWYALSPRFRKMASNVINSDTRGQLTLTDTTGTASTSNIVAVVIAPGQTLGGQSRDTANANNAASYLENTNAGTTGTYTYTTTAQPSDTFNDRIIAITEAELFAVVEPVVASMIERDVKPYLATYYTQWANAFPFPTQFANPDPGSNSNVSPPVTTRTQAQYVGDITQTPGGLLPVTATATYPLNAGTESVTMTGGIYGVFSSGPSCTDVTLPIGTYGFYCTFTLRALNSVATCGAATPYCLVNPSFQVRGDIANIGMSVANMADIDVRVTNTSDTTNRTMLSRTVSRTISATGVATMTFQGTHDYSVPSTSYRTGTFTRSFRVTFPVLASALASTTQWFIANEWYRLTYYAVSPGHLPGGGGTCTALPGTPSCLTVNSMPSYYASPNTNKRAILILGGRPLNGTSRPSPTLANNYLEGENATPADYVFEHRAGLPSSINDRAVVICPDSALCP